MKLTFLGSGSAFTVGGNYHSNMLLESNLHKKLLIDCGSDVRLSLYEQGYSYQDAQDVYISHLHADHAGGLEWLAFSSKFNKNKQKPRLYLSQELPEQLWYHHLFASLNPAKDPSINLSSFFEVRAISNSEFEWEGICFHLIPTTHITFPSGKMPSYGLWFKAEGKAVLITTDAQLTADIQELYDQSDIIFQDCETSNEKSGVHAHYTELMRLKPEIKSKMWLYHYQPGALPDAKKDGFQGFVKKGQRFDI